MSSNWRIESAMRLNERSCAHCGRTGHCFAQVNKYPLCHPNEGMDCYRLVTIYDEPIGARKPGGELYGKRTPIPDNSLNDWSR